MKKRLVAFLLVLIMVLGMLPVSAFAADDGVSPQALESNETQTIKYQILYVGDEFNTGYSYGVSVNKTYTCQYSTGHSGFNHSILISEFRNVGVPALKGQLDSGYEFVGWAKEAKENPTIYDFNVAGTTATQTTYTIYLVAKKTNPTPTYMYYLYYKYNDGTDSTWLTDVTDRPTAATTFTFNVNRAKLTRSGYDHIGWADKADAVTAKYTGGDPIVLTKDNPTKTIYAIWMPFFELKYDANGGTGAPASQTRTAAHPTVNRVTFTVPNQTPSKEGYTFKGWADSSTATTAQYQPGDTVDVKHENSPKTVYAVWEGSDPIPVPSYDDLKSAIGKIQVKDVSTPSCGTENYDLIDNTQSEPFNWTKTARLDQPGKYDVTIKTAPYVAKYNSEKSKTHELNNANQTTLKLVISYENNTWKLDDGLRVIEVKHSEQTPPTDKPDKPTKNDVTGVVVDIVCVTTTGTHDTVQYPLGHPTDAQHTIGEVVSDGAGGYICPVTVRTAWFVQQASNLVWKVQHTPTAQTITFNLTYDKNSKTWVKPAANPRIEATHEVTPPTKPTALDGSFAIVCKNNKATHPYKADYIATPSQYTISDVQMDNQGYYVTATVTVAPNLVAYNTATRVEHRLVNEQDATLTITFRYDTEVTVDGNRKWKQQGDLPVVEVICKVIEAPTREDIFGALNGLVTVTCINRFWKDGNKNMDCGQGQYAAKAGIAGQEYTLEKGENAGTWVVTFPVTNFVKSFKQDPAHNLYTKDTLRWYIRWENNAWTSAPVEPGVDDLVKLTPAPTDWREVAKIATGGKSDCIHVSCVNGETGVCDYGITVPFVYSATDVVSVEPEDGVPGSYIATFKVDRYIDTCAKACNDKNFKDAPRTHKLLTQETVQWRLYATSEADEKIGNNVLNHVWAADPVTPGTDDVCTIAHNWVVTFDPNGGTPVPLAQEVEYGHTATKPVEPTLKGYTFVGWYLDGEEEPFDFGTTITSDITLTAKWEINKYTVTFDSYGGSKVDPQVVEYGLYAQEPEEPTLKGFTFAYWYLDDENEAYDFENTPVTADITLTAKWEINKYTVTFDSYGGSKVDPQVVEYGLYAQEPEEPTLKGFTFAYWYLDDENEAYDFENTPVTADITLTAKWNINKYTVAFNTDGGTPVPPAQEVEYGLTATEPAAPEKTGYTFDGWYLGDEKYDFSAAVEQNITLTAKWEKKTYKVVAKLYVNGKPAYYQNTDFYTYEVSGSYGEDIDFDTIKAKAVEQAKQIKKASASYTAVILEDHEPNAVCATYGEHQPNQATHYVKVNVKTEENVVIFQSFEGKTDLTKLHTTTAPYGTNVVEFLNGLGLDLDVAGYTLDTDEDGNTNWYKKDSPKWTFGANDTINGWTNVLLKYTITPHNIYAYLRTGDSIGDVLELNEATLNRLGLTKYNTEGFISIGTFVSNTLLTQDEYYGFDEDEAFLDVLAELQTKLVPETGVSLDKVGSKINWSWLYQPSDVDDRIAGYPTEDTDGYQLSGSLLLYGAKFEAGANDVTGMPTAAYGAYLDYFVSGESFNLPAAPTRPGYDFKGWKIGNAVLTAGAAYTVDEDDMVFTAQWEARTDTPYTVEHYLENLDGSYALDTTEPLKGTTDTTVTAAAKSYDNFTYDSTVPDTVASGNIAGDGSLVLKLFYTRNTYDYTVRHIKQLPDGSYDEANAEVETLSGKFEALAAVTAKDYGEHYPTNDADTKQNIKIEKGLTIDVKYDLDEHTLTFETNGGSAINPVTVRHGNAVARPADPTKDKYTFIGWYADPEFTEEYDFATVLEADKTIYAKFELTSTPIGDIYVRYDVLHIKQLPDGTYDLANAEVEHLRALKDSTVTAVIKDYRATHHVNVNRTLSKLTGTAIQPYMGVDGKPVYTILSVYYDLDFHTLTFDTMGGSKIAPETVRHGLTVAKPKDPVNGGYIFDGWYTDKTFRHRYDFSTPLTEDITIYAKWFLIVLPGVTVKKNTPKLNTADHFAYVQGYPDGTVKPAGNITRAETAAILFRLMDDASRKTYYSTKSGFRDVASGSWYNTYVATLNNAGVITDSSNGCFRPNEAITRAELAAMLAKFSETTGAANYFNDVSAKYWAANAIAICAKLGWINGYPDGTFRPDKNVTRAELMAMINRATGRAPKSADAFLPGMKTWIDNTSDKWYYLDVQEATNSHSYTVKGSETWTALTSDPNWSLYE